MKYRWRLSWSPKTGPPIKLHNRWPGRGHDGADAEVVWTVVQGGGQSLPSGVPANVPSYVEIERRSIEAERVYRKNQFPGEGLGIGEAVLAGAAAATLCPAPVGNGQNSGTG